MPTEKDKNSIFRAEALQHKQEGWFGPSRLHIPSSLSVCLFIGLITLSFIVLIITFGPYSKRVNTTGTVVYDPPAVLLIAQSDGIITHSSALEGKIIKRNELIFSVSGDTRTSLGATNAEMVGLLKKQRNALAKKIVIVASESEETRSYLAKKIKNKEQEIESMRNLIKKSEEQSAWFEKKSNQYASFRGKGIALDTDLIERTKDYYLATESLSSAKVKIITLSGELLDLKNQASSIDRNLDEKQESFIIEGANIDQKILDAEKNKEYLIIAPFDGVITSVTAHVGERVTKGQQIAVLVPHGAAVRVELLSLSDSLGEVTNGQRVKMRVAAYPYQWYGKVAGIIETISAAPINMTSPVQAKGDSSGKGLFRIVVRPELTDQQTDISLLPGMEVETEIYVKTRKVYEWLFVPIKKAYERITGGASDWLNLMYNTTFWGLLMACVNVHCPRCDSVLVYRHGQNPKGHSRFRCRECRSVFQLTYTYQARKPGVKEKIVDMAFNGAGVRDTARTLKVGINTVIRTLKNSRQSE